LAAAFEGCDYGCDCDCDCDDDGDCDVGYALETEEGTNSGEVGVLLVVQSGANLPQTRATKDVKEELKIQSAQ
jgi:hypothetical protein